MTARITRSALLFVAGSVVAAALLLVLGKGAGGLPPLGTLLDPKDGLYRTARQGIPAASEELVLAGIEADVRVLRDERGVPHIFAASDLDAVRALGYVVAQDRLFQLDFLPRVAAGRLASILGPSAVETDRFLRQTGMEWGAQKNLARIREEGGIAWDLLEAFASGVNAYVDGLAARDLPFEFRLLGYRPDRYAPIQTMRLLQYMAYDLSYGSDDAAYAELQARMSPEDYALLYPANSRLYVPIIPEKGGGVGGTSMGGWGDGGMRERGREGEKRRQGKEERGIGEKNAHTPTRSNAQTRTKATALLSQRAAFQKKMLGSVLEGFVEGKGSNNWAVGGSRSATGAPILAGDMHLSLSLPAIWYEVHLVTPTMNTYGVTIPGAPLPVEAFNDYVGWAYTNTGADVIDHYALDLDSTGTRYRCARRWCDIALVPDTIFVKGAAPAIDTLRYAHWGPVMVDSEGGAVALKWTAHDSSRLLQAIWGMNHAKDYDDFEAALRFWDTPMQNILYADVHGTVAIRSTGYLPIRRSGSGAGLLDGSTDASEWIGRVPFDQLPHSVNPEQGFLTSTNQQPADSTYPYYINHDWHDSYRSLRIDTLLRAKDRHAASDLKRYQADVRAVQRDLFVPLLDTLAGLSPRADTLRQMLSAWNGETTVDRPEPLVLDVWLDALEALTWDEAAFENVPEPGQTQLRHLLRDAPASPWLDVQATPEREHAGDLLRLALERTAESLEEDYGWGAANWRWGDHHKVVFRHLTRSAALQSLWRGPVEYPGFAATLSPASALTTTHSASWRMVVDFSQTPPEGWGVYPGGQSGSPFSSLYADHLPTYLAFEYYDLLKPRAPSDLDSSRVLSEMVFRVE
ncbi:MAG: penicillin acylase family protein [Rhodothermales bacterium]